MLFNKEEIYLDVEAKDRNDLFEKMAKIFKEKGYIKDEYLQSLKEREDNYPTGLAFDGYSVAIPHTSYNYINEQNIIFVRLKNPIIFKEMGTTDVEIEVKVVLMLLITKGTEQVTVLLNLMGILGDKNCYEVLEKSNDKTEIYDMLVKKYNK